MARLTPLLLASLFSLLPSATAKTNSTTPDFPAVLELDQVFPQNATYAPAPVFPIVFALQGLPAAWSSTYVRASWILSPTEGVYPGKYDNGTVTVDHADYADPYYITGWSSRLNSTDTPHSYYLYWTLEYEECLSTHPPGGGILRTQNGVVRFTLAPDSDKKAKQADLLDVVDKCPVVNGAVTIMGPLAVDGPPFQDLINQTRTECAVLDRVVPKGDPCAAKLDEKTAKNITAELKASACAASPPAVTDGCNGEAGGKGDDDSGAGMLTWGPGVLMGCVVASVMQWYL